MTQRITPGQIKKNNRQQIYNYIYEQGNVSQQAIAYALKLSRPTVATNLSALEEDGLICKNGQLESDQIGRKAVAYAIVADYRIAIGVEIMRHVVKLIAVDLYGRKLRRDVAEIEYRNAEGYYERVSDMIRTFIAALNVPLERVLGIGIAVALVLGWGLAFFLHSRNFSGSEWEGRLWTTLCNVYSTVFAYFECMLIGAVICGVKAAKHEPNIDADYILILGCRFRRGGTLPPLLRGRVDRAVEYWRDRTGCQSVLVPSGGQGADEPMPEAEAMRRYLLDQGVPGTCILLEDQSKNTYQNMAYSKMLIEERNPHAKVVYATTNYHVFRSGVWASLAGLPAEGVGSRTKWWYWPNAFMRECAGLMMNRIPQELLLLAIMIVFFGALSMALG